MEYNYQYQSEKLSDWRKILENIVQQQPTKKEIVEDIEFFIEDHFFSYQRNCDLTIINLDKSISLKWDNIDLEINFYENHFWSYKYIDTQKEGQETVSFTGKGERLEVGTSIMYCFYLSDTVDNAFKIKEEFSPHLVPLLGINKTRRNFPNSVSPLWITDVYDGPLAGFCYLNNKLCYFDLAEETTYERDRLFAIYEVDNIYAIKSYWKYSVLPFLGNKINVIQKLTRWHNLRKNKKSIPNLYAEKRERFNKIKAKWVLKGYSKMF